tara:strand:- start:3943 stop:4443 length:501 start_codon:yes stop_codon:yes gene_type:complete
VNTENLIQNIDAIFFDFDGVLTNNLVYTSSNGDEFVSCNRSDGLAFEVLKLLSIKIYIISSEKNSVVKKRASKLKVKCFSGIKDKSSTIKKISKKDKFSLRNSMFVGNDLNDFSAMKLCKYTACPSDSHAKIKRIVKFKLRLRGGEGIVRELVEEVFKINVLKYIK